MDRSRFQVGIGTMMVAVVAIAVPLAIARAFGAAWALNAFGPLTRLVFYAHVRGRCRAEGRPMSEADRARVRTLDIRVGIPVFLAGAVLLFSVFPILVF